MKVINGTGASKDDWVTPDYLWKPALEAMGAEYFTADPCADEKYSIPAKCHSTKAGWFRSGRSTLVDGNGLDKAWNHVVGETGHDKYFWVNPPCSRGNIPKWVTKVVRESATPNYHIFLLIPTDHSTDAYQKAQRYSDLEMRLVDRVSFLLPGGRPVNSNPSPSTIFYFGSEARRVRSAYDNVAMITATL